nr:hypothetical protein Iba_chr10aCG4050 [Ipomoea batatas]GMD41848.1 hypothetical protein Iba_chr10bCG3630 [Ipomoea batatas]GMD43044.1 hypothetical protein Iba_chr10cCG1490 [Ipomoea batatas]GMD44808.1 hypothetical protein Iba_chr10dCG4030 [Ipomoea batatas]GMD46448.1 hypothetical protein Iba_chr10eCG3380 [Ipomoea batatas]
MLLRNFLIWAALKFLLVIQLGLVLRVQSFPCLKPSAKLFPWRSLLSIFTTLMAKLCLTFLCHYRWESAQ